MKVTFKSTIPDPASSYTTISPEVSCDAREGETQEQLLDRASALYEEVARRLYKSHAKIRTIDLPELVSEITK